MSYTEQVTDIELTSADLFKGYLSTLRKLLNEAVGSVDKTELSKAIALYENEVA